MRKWKTWIPVLTLVGIAVGFLAKRTFAPPREELSIQPPPAAQIPPLELPARDLSFEGQVVAPGGSAVPDALVWLRAGDEPHWTYTDAQGHFRLDGLEKRPWLATVLALGFSPLALPPILDSAGPQTIQLGKPLDPAPSLPPLSRTRLAGTVSSHLALALEGCEVVLTPVLPPQNLDAPLPRRAIVGADGRFELPDLIAGDYRVEVLPAWARGGSWPDLTLALEGVEPRTFSHAAGDAPQELPIELRTGDVLGKLVGLDGSSIEGALILVAQASDPSRVWPPESSAADGTFAVRGVPAGKYLLAIRAGSAAVQQEVEVRAGEALALDLSPLEVRRAR